MVDAEKEKLNNQANIIEGNSWQPFCRFFFFHGHRRTPPIMYKYVVVFFAASIERKNG